MRKKIGAILSVLAFVLCFIQAIKVDLIERNMKSNNATEMQVFDTLKIKNIVIEDPENVNLEEYSLANKAPIIAQIINSKELDENTIEDIGQAIVYVEMRYLGCSNPPWFKIGDYSYSYYDVEDNVIYLSEKEKMTEYKDFIKKILHLCHHVYQYKQMEMFELLEATNEDYDKLLLMLDVRYWYEEKEFYTGCIKECEELWMEKDAEKYARTDFMEYVEAIEHYWDGFEEEIKHDFIEQSVTYTL